MESSLLLLYVGTMLVASGLVRRAGYLACLSNLIFGTRLLMYALVPLSLKRRPHVRGRRGITRMVLLWGFVVVVLAIAVPLILVGLAISNLGRNVGHIDMLLTEGYLSLMRQVPDRYQWLGRQIAYLPRCSATQRLERLLEENPVEKLNKYVQQDVEDLSKDPLPFVGSIGLILVTVGFVLKVT